MCFSLWVSVLSLCIDSCALKSHLGHIVLLLLAVVNKIKLSCPAICHAGAKGERMFFSYSFLTLALDGDERSVSRPGCAFPLLGNDPRYPLGRRPGGLQSWLVWTQRLEEKSYLRLLGIKLWSSTL
jgi:hypothetical protein